MRALRVARRILLGILAALLLVTAIVAVLVSLRGVRERALLVTLDRIVRPALPGTLAVGRATWPSLRTVQLEDVLWTVDADTLVTCRSAQVEARLSPLFRGQVVLRQVDARDLRANVPRIQSSLSSDTAAKPTPAKKSGGGVPLAIESLSLSAGPIVITDSETVQRLEASLAADLTDPMRPTVTLHRIDASAPDGQWTAQAEDLHLDLRARRVRGQANVLFQKPYPLSMSIRSEGGDTILVEADPGADAPCADGALKGKVVLRPDDSFGFELELVIPEVACLQQVPALREALADWENLESTTTTVDGELRLDPIQAEARLELTPNGWIDRGTMRARLVNSTTTLDSLRLDIRGLSLAASGTLDEERIDASVRLRAEDARWLSLAPRATPPEELELSLDARAQGDRFAPRLTGNLRGRVVQGSIRIDDVDLAARTIDDEQVEVTLSARAWEHHMAMRSHVSIGDVVTARVAPIRISTQDRAASAAGTLRGMVQFDRATGSTSVQDLRVVGTTGDAVLSGTLRRDQPSTLQAVVRWPTLPSLWPALTGMDIAQRDSLDAAWDPQSQVTAEATLQPSGDATASASFHLPGPARLRALFPAGARLGDLGALRGEATATRRSDRTSIDVSLEETGWIERARLRGGGTPQDFAVDELALQALGMELTGAGVIGETLDLDATLRVNDTRAVERFAPGTLDSLTLTVQTELRGSRTAPRLTGQLRGAARGPSLTVPALAADVSLDEQGWTARLRAPDNTLSTLLDVDVDANLRAERDGTAGRLSARVVSPRLQARTGASFRRGETTTIEADTLRIAIQDTDLAATQPFQVSIGSDGTRLDGLRLAGSVGTVEFDGAFDGEQLRGNARLDLTLPETPPWPGIPVELWPAEVKGSLSAREGDDLTADLAVSELPWAGSTLAIELQARTEGDSLRTVLTARQGDALRMSIDAVMPRVAMGSALLDQLNDASVRGSLDCFPVPVAADPLRATADQAACLDGRFSLRNLRTAPAMSGGLDLTFPGWPRLSAYRLDVQVVGSGDRRSGADPLQSAEVLLETRLTRDQTPVLDGTAKYAVARDGEAERGTIELDLQSQQLRLGDFTKLLPADMAAGGTLSLRFHAEGDVTDPALDGTVSGPVEFSTAQGLKVKGNTSLKLGGSLRRPAVNGDVTIEQGTIPIPDAPKTLHPTSGEAELWASRVDTTLRDVAPAARTPAEVPAADLDVRVQIPSGLWIRGRGLEAELAGNLQIQQTGTTPSVGGELRATRGSLLMLGRTFRFERGGVFFDGGEDIDPDLDLALTTTVDDILIRVVFGGTAQAPKLRLESEPERPEGDIVSYLLFGRSVDQLDTDQTTYLESRATDIATSMGLAGLESRIARELGMDMVRIRREQGANTIVLGKYLSPKVLLQYEQALNEDRDTRLNLEYLLFQGFKIDTLFGRESQSGIGLTWERSY